MNRYCISVYALVNNSEITLISNVISANNDNEATGYAYNWLNSRFPKDDSIYQHQDFSIMDLSNENS